MKNLQQVNNSINPVQKMSFNRQGQGRLDRYLVSKKVNNEGGGGQVSALNSAVKVKNADSLNRLQGSSVGKQQKREKTQDYQPFGGETQILTVIPLKKSAKKEYKDTDTEQLHTSNQQLSKSLSISFQNRHVFPQLILIGPFDLVNNQILQRKLQQLMIQCNKKTIIQWIKSRNEKSESIRNYQLVERYEDEQFWCLYTQKIIQMLLKEQRQVNSCIRLLPRLFQNQEIVLTRKKIFLLVASMFFCIIPPQCNTNLVSLIELMVLRSFDQKNKQKSLIRFQKLKCVINYLKSMVDNPEIYEERVIVYRVHSSEQISRRERDTPLSEVIIQDGKIEEGYGKGIIIDFANENVGGGFLTNGSAQEEILFSIFPQMIVTKLLCETLNENQAIIIKGARRFNNYEGYLASFRYLGSYQSEENCPQESCIVAIDALDFSKIVTGKHAQYNKKFIRRQLHKAHLGIQGGFLAVTSSIEKPQVFTGRWGCGIFHGDEILKFLIQWISCSQVGVNMRFFTTTEKSLQMRLLYQNLKDQTASSLLSLIQSYGDLKQLSQKGFLGYLKYNS